MQDWGCYGMREQLDPDPPSVCVCACASVCVSHGGGQRQAGIRDSWHFILTVLKWQIKYCLNSSSSQSLHTFDPRTFAVRQATLRFPLSGSSQLWFGSVRQPQPQRVFLFGSLSATCSEHGFWLLLKQNASWVLPCQAVVYKSSTQAVIPLFGGFCQLRRIWKQLLHHFLQHTSL